MGLSIRTKLFWAPSPLQSELACQVKTAQPPNRRHMMDASVCSVTQTAVVLCVCHSCRSGARTEQAATRATWHRLTLAGAYTARGWQVPGVVRLPASRVTA